MSPLGDSAAGDASGPCWPCKSNSVRRGSSPHAPQRVGVLCGPSAGVLASRASPTSVLPCLASPPRRCASSCDQSGAGAIETFIRREDAERFVEEVRGDEPELASYLLIEERELKTGGAELLAGSRRPLKRSRRTGRYRREQVTVTRSLLILALVAVLTVTSDAPAGGISDETCPNIAGEYTNTCPAGTVGVPYSIRFSETEGSGCGPGRQTFHLDSGMLPPGLNLAPDGTLSGTSFQPGGFQFYVEMREPGDDPANCAGKRTQKQFTLKVRRQPWIVSTPAVTPRSEVGVPFRMTLRARGGSGIFAWTLAAGQLPSGLRIGVDGSISGTARTPGIYRFAARAKDPRRAR